VSIQIDRCTTKRTWKEMDDWQTNKTEGEEVKTERDNKENEMKENKRKRGRARKREGLKTINAEDSYDESRIEPRLLFVALSSAGCPHSARARSGSAAGPPPFAGVRARALRKTITRGGWGGGREPRGGYALGSLHKDAVWNGTGWHHHVLIVFVRSFVRLQLPTFFSFNSKLCYVQLNNRVPLVSPTHSKVKLTSRSRLIPKWPIKISFLSKLP
jgi:hypothetical protein